MACNQLQFSVRHAGRLGEPSDGLVPERMGRGLYLCQARVVLDHLLDATGRELRAATSLEEPTIGRMSRDMRPKCGREGSTEQHVPILRALPLIDSDLAVLQVHIFDPQAAKLGDTDAGVEQQPKHQAVLHIIRLIDDSVESAELVGR